MEIKDTIKKLQKEAEYFLKHAKLIVNGIEILPKEIEVYYFKEGEFEDKSVHRNELQKNNKNHFYVHRWGLSKNDKYKGGNYPGVDLVISDNDNEYYSYLIRSAVINNSKHPIIGPNKVLKEIIECCKFSDYKDLEDNSSIDLVSNNITSEVLFSSRINISEYAEEFRCIKLRAVLCDDSFYDSKYPAKEYLIKFFLSEKKKQENMTKDQMLKYAENVFGYKPHKIIQELFQ